MSPPSMDILIVNWNAGQQLRQCVESINSAQKTGIDLQRVVVVDNGSVDGSADGIEEFDLPLRMIRSRENMGFGAACNRAAERTTADYLLFLNPDTRLFPNSLNSPLQYLERPENDHIGILGIQLVNEKGEIHRSSVRFPHLKTIFAITFGLNRLFPKHFYGLFLSDWNHRETREVDQVMGAFFLVRRKLFESLGGFDERFFVYFEDLDFSLRARNAGWKSLYFIGARCFHKGCGVSDQTKAKRLFYILRSRILYVQKHFYISATILTLFGILLFELPARLALSAIHVRLKEAGEILLAYRLLTNWLKKHPPLAAEGRE